MLTKGYCVWLVPPRSQSTSLETLISSLSSSASTLTGVKSPPFTPHITLFSPRSAIRSDLNEMKRRTSLALDAYASGSNASDRHAESGTATPRPNSDAYASGSSGTTGASAADPAARGQDGGGAGSLGGPVEIVLNNPCAGEKYYQCVLSPVDEAEGRGRDLERLRAAFCNAFEESQPFYFPHLSLIYGDMDEDSRWKLADEAVAKGTWPAKSDFAEVVVVDINGYADQWKIVERYQL